MDIDAIVKLGALVVAMFALPKIWRETQGLRFSHRKGTYELARDLIKEVADDGHPLLIEMGYRSLYNSAGIGAPEITYLLSMPRPSQALWLYARGQKFLEFVDGVSDGTPSVGFRSSYRKRGARLLHRSFFLSAYVISFFIASAPMLFAYDQLGKSNPPFTFSAVCVAIAFGFLAYFSLMQFAKNLAAERFIELQSGAG